MGVQTVNIVQVNFSLRRWKGPALPGTRQRVYPLHCAFPHLRIPFCCSDRLCCVSPSAAATGSAVHSFTCASLSAAVPVAHLASSTVPGLAFLHFPTAWPGSVFVPPSATFLGFAYAGTNTQTMFWGEIMPGNAPTHTHFSPGHPLNLEKTCKF